MTHNHVEQVGTGVRVRAETNLQVTGPQAASAARSWRMSAIGVLGEFAQRLEQEIAPEGAPGASTATRGQDASPRPTTRSTSVPRSHRPRRADRFDVARRSFWRPRATDLWRRRR